MAKAADFRSKSPDQLKEDLLQLKKEQFNLRFQQATGQLERPPASRSSVAISLASRPCFASRPARTLRRRSKICLDVLWKA